MFLEQFYKSERDNLSKYAQLSEKSQGRLKEITPCDMRTCYQRDYDRILHSKSFRRLKHKTQVFFAPEKDHYRTRLTHTLEVSQIARTIARLLKLNENLAEAISFGHDLGHTPFGHSGERTLNKITGGFAHNEQSLRVVDILENGVGLNLTFEVRDGILNHRKGLKPKTLEGMVVNLADRIAYVNHDFDDAVRAKIVSADDMPKDVKLVFGLTHGERIERMISKVVDNSLGKDHVAMDNESNTVFEDMRKFMFERIYDSVIVRLEEEKAGRLITELFEYYEKNIDEMPAEYQVLAEEYGNTQSVIDYIAGMTDRYAVNLYEELFIPRGWRY